MRRLVKINSFIIFTFLLVTLLAGKINSNPWASDSKSPLFRKTPYLIFNGQNTEMTVLWQLYEQQTCILKWGTDSLYSKDNTTVSEYKSDFQYAYIFTDLVPGKKYYYQVIVKSNAFKGSFNAAPDKNALSTHFYVYGDTQFNPKVHNEIAKKITHTVLKEKECPSFVVHTGDLTDDGAKELYWDREFFNQDYVNINRLQSNLPILGCIGNHDSDFYGKSTLYVKYLPYPFVKGRYWSFDYGPAHFFMFDIISGGHPKEYEKFIFEQLDYLKKDLSACTKEWKFIVLHYPGWSADKDYNWYVREYLQPICIKFKVDIVFAGHHHLYSHVLVDNIHHITTGGGGGRLSHTKPIIKDEKTIAAKRIHHYCHVTINGKNLLLKACDINGNKIDEFELIHN